MSSAQQQIDQAKALLQQHGIGEAVTPAQLIGASKELGKSLRETLAYVAKLFAQSEGTV